MAPPEILDADSFEPEIEYLGCKVSPAKLRNTSSQPIVVLDSDDEDQENLRSSCPALVPQVRL
jgi:hypothetical protein